MGLTGLAGIALKWKWENFRYLSLFAPSLTFTTVPVQWKAALPGADDEFPPSVHCSGQRLRLAPPDTSKEPTRSSKEPLRGGGRSEHTLREGFQVYGDTQDIFLITSTAKFL